MVCLLIGGGALGIYHYGVIKTLIERAAFPRVISGSSAGSMFAALIGVTKPEDLHKVSPFPRDKRNSEIY